MNQVHQRVYPGETLAYSIENIRKERAIELAFEGCSLLDLMRYEKKGWWPTLRIITAPAQNGTQRVTNGGNRGNHFVLEITSLPEEGFDADS